MIQQYQSHNTEAQLQRNELQPPISSLFSSSSLSSQFQNLNPEQIGTFKDLIPPTQQRYQIRYGDLIGNKISPLNRFILLRWLQIQTQRQNYSRQIFALTTYYLDLFIQNKYSIPLKKMQNIVLGALLLATKIQGTHFPSIGGELNKKQVLQAEQQLCLTLDYFLYPKTYIFYLDLFTTKWDKFIDQKKGIRIQQKYLVQSGPAFNNFRVLYQRMEFINMTAQSCRFSLVELVFNLFFIQNSLNCRIGLKEALSEDYLTTFVNSSYNLQDEYSDIFIYFCQFCGLSDELNDLIDRQIGLYLIHFLTLPIGVNAPTRNASSYNQYRKMQTTNLTGQDLLEKLISEKKLK